MVKVTLWEDKALVESAKKHSLNLSQIFKESLLQKLKDIGAEVKLSEPLFEIVVKCPFCEWKQTVHTVKRVVCFNCEKTFSVFPRRKPSAVVSITKGNIEVLKKARRRGR